jgi:hypothetical protein
MTTPNTGPMAASAAYAIAPHPGRGPVRVYNGRPCQAGSPRRVRHQRAGWGYYDVVEVEYLDGVAPYSEVVPCGKFNTGCRRKREG